ncbi:MAG: hypothetical protein ACJ8GK_04125 [Luteimonas sp.]
MPSSISNSDQPVAASASASIGIPLGVPGSPLPGPGAGEHFVRPGFVRKTASDRPGVAQPVPERDVPAQPWSRIFLTAVVLAGLALVGWEAYWRAFGAVPGYHNGNDAWALQRRRIDDGEGSATVLTGASRVLFDVQLPVWQQATGERPIQLALEGTSPVPVLEDLAADPNFTGRVLVGVAPDIFFSGFAYRGEAIGYFHKETPAQRAGTWLARHLVEPYFAFYDADFALPVVVRRQPWPQRPGLRKSTRVRKLLVQEADRNSHMWRKVETDPHYRALVRSIWAEDFGAPPPGMETPAKARKTIDTQIARTVAAIAKLRARGVEVLFLRAPSSGPYYAYEQKYFPRAQTWEVLLQRTAAPGIHFEDYPQLQGYEQPEWSHLSAADARRFTAALVPIVQRQPWRRADARATAP